MVEKRVKKFGQGSPPTPFWAMPERKHFFSGLLPLYNEVNNSSNTASILFLHPCSVVLHLSAVVVGGLLRLLNASQDSLRKPQAYQALLRPGSP